MRPEQLPDELELVRRRWATAPPLFARIQPSPEGHVVVLGPFKKASEALAISSAIDRAESDICRLIAWLAKAKGLDKVIAEVKVQVKPRPGRPRSRPRISLAERAPIGPFITALRLEKGLSMTELARRAGFKHAHVWQIEAGRIRWPAVATMRKLAAGLGVPAEELVAELEKRRNGK